MKEQNHLILSDEQRLYPKGFSDFRSHARDLEGHARINSGIAATQGTLNTELQWHHHHWQEQQQQQQLAWPGCSSRSSSRYGSSSSSSRELGSHTVGRASGRCIANAEHATAARPGRVSAATSTPVAATAAHHTCAEPATALHPSSTGSLACERLHQYMLQFSTHSSLDHNLNKFAVASEGVAAVHDAFGYFTQRLY